MALVNLDSEEEGVIVRLYDEEGKFLEESTETAIGIYDPENSLKKGSPIILHNSKKYEVVSILPPLVDWKKNILFRPIELRRQ
jgi:hypothetical protein